MKAAQQKVVDKYHEKVISLIYQRRKTLRFNSSGGQAEWEAITAQIDKVEDERRAYEKSVNYLSLKGEACRQNH
jgi:hypothetical protein